MQQVLFSDDEHKEALHHLDQLMRDAENMSNVDDKVLFYNVLQYFDSIHREPLLRVMQVVKSDPQLLQRIGNDETIKNICALYDIELEVKPVDGVKTLAFVPESEVTFIEPPKKKDWLELGNIAELEQNKVYPKNYEKVNFLVTRVQSTVYAIQNQCEGSFLPIDKGTVENHYLICPWHGCKYDLKTGKTIDGIHRQLDTFPVEIADNGTFQVEIAYQ